MPHIRPRRETLQIPGDVLTDITRPPLLITIKLNQILSMSTQRIHHLPQIRTHPHITTVKRRSQISEQPRTPQTTTTNNHPIAARALHHPQRILSRPNVPITQHRNLRNGLLQPRNRIQIRMTAIRLRCCTTMQRNRCSPHIHSTPTSIQIRQVISIDPHPHLHRHRNPTTRSFSHRHRNNVREQIQLPRQRRTPTLTRHLRHRTPKIQINMIRQPLIHHHPRSPRHRHRIHAVQLHRPRKLIGIKLNQLHRLRRTLHQRPRSNHLAHIQTTPPIREPFSSETPTQTPEGTICHPRHRCKNDRSGDRQRTDHQRRKYMCSSHLTTSMTRHIPTPSTRTQHGHTRMGAPPTPAIL